MFNFIRNISSTEIIIIVLILVVLFGSRIMMRIGKVSGETVKEIKKIKKEFTETLEDADNESSKN